MSSTKKFSTEKLKKLMNRQRLQSGFTFVLAALLLFQVVQFYQFRERIQFIDGLVERNEMVLSDVDKGKEYLSSFGADLNEIRQFLLLPTKEYDFNDLMGVTLASDEEGQDLNTEMFDFVSSLGTYEKNQALYAANLAALQADLGSSVWTDAGLTLETATGKESEEHIEFVFTDATLNGQALLKIDLGYDGLFSVPLFYNKVELSTADSWPEVFATIQDYLKKELPDLRVLAQTVNGQREVLKGILASEAVQGVLQAKGMALSGEQENEEQYFYQLRNSQLSALGEFTVLKKDGSLHFSVEEPVQEGFDGVTLDGTASDALLEALNTQVDARTDAQKQLDDKKADLAAVMNDKAFQATLDKLGLHFGAETENEQRVEYPLLNAAGETLRVIFIDKSSLDVKVSLPDGQNAQTLSLATEELLAASKKKLWICLIPCPATLIS